MAPASNALGLAAPGCPSIRQIHGNPRLPAFVSRRIRGL
jgi:hypothetical protein